MSRANLKRLLDVRPTPKLAVLLFAALNIVAWLAPNAHAADKLAGNHSETLLTDA
jgi:hypothetical protein